MSDNLIFFFTSPKWYFHQAFTLTVILFFKDFPRCTCMFDLMSMTNFSLKGRRWKLLTWESFISMLEPWQVFRSGCHGAGPGTQRVIGQADRHSAGEVVSGGKGLWERNKWEGWKVGGMKKWEGWKVERRVSMLNTIKNEIFTGDRKFH